MFAWWGRTVVRARWAVLVAGVLLALVGGVWGTGVFGTVKGAGFDDPASESSRARERIAAEVGQRATDIVVIWSSETATVDDPAFRRAVTDAVDRVRQKATVVSFYDTGSDAFVSTDRRSTYAVVSLATPAMSGDTKEFEAIRPDLDAAGLRTEVGGPAAVNDAVSAQVSKDIARAETFSMPILLVLLVLVFGSLVAAGAPLLVGVLAILGAFTVTRILTLFTDVSVFALNVITLIGLGMAIDYALFMVSRFREELRQGHDTGDAVARTVDTAGRTVLVSGLTVALALAGLLLFPQMFLKSMAYGGMAAVLVAMVASVTVLPALLAVLGPRINAVRIFRTRDGGGTGWARLARGVMRRPVLVTLGTVALLAVLAVPFTRAEFGVADERVLPASAAPRGAAETLAREFPQTDASPVQVLVSGAGAGAAGAFAERITAIEGVTSAAVVAVRGDSAAIAVSYTGGPSGETARGVVGAIRDLPTTAGAEVLDGGTTAQLVDLLRSLADRLPWMALLVALSTFVLLFLAFGSLVLPLKAILMNVVSIGASFGAVVWAFQDGHLAGLLGFTSTGNLEATQLILMLALIFGLSTDYEVFLLSRVREEWDRTAVASPGDKPTAADNTAAVAGGLQRTGGIITAAALLLIVVIGGFTTGDVLFIKMIGFGMIVALVVDATIVRALLVPATMKLLGRANWWLPAPLARVYGRFGIREEKPVPERELATVSA
ncbi:MMPL family transporter [Virgisporangium ochraceum]